MTQDEQWLLKEKYGGEKTDGFFADCERLKKGEPLGYVIGWVPFLNTKIWLDSHPLIPRPETEFWTEQAIAVIKKVATSSRRPVRILDLCAGSGCIGVAVANAVQNVKVDFAEIEEAHLPTIEKNLMINDISLRDARVIQSDLFENITSTYDFILANPPYIDPALDRTEASVKAHEPHQALYGGKEGIEIIFRILSTARKYLTSVGQLWLEHEPEQIELISSLATTRNLAIETHTDQFGHARYSVLSVELEQWHLI